MVDALASGASVRKDMGVRVPPSAQRTISQSGITLQARKPCIFRRGSILLENKLLFGVSCEFHAFTGCNTYFIVSEYFLSL